MSQQITPKHQNPQGENLQLSEISVKIFSGFE